MERDREPISIATYNIRTDTELDGPIGSPFRWNARFPLMKEVFATYDWDIVGIQEAMTHQLADLLAMDGYDFVGRKRGTDVEAEHTPILYKKDKFELLETETKWLSSSQKEHTLAEEWGAAYPRIFTVAHLKRISSGETLWVVNTHLDHVSEEARYQSARQIVRYLQDKSSDDPLFLLGDFNEDRQGRWYEVVSKHLRDASKLSPHHVGPDGTYRGVDFFQELKWDGLKPIDYLFVNHAVAVLETSTVTDQFQGYFPSDHFAVAAKVMLKKEEVHNG